MKFRRNDEDTGIAVEKCADTYTKENHMTRLVAILTSVILATLWLAAPGPAADTAMQPAGMQDTQSTATSGPRGQTDPAKKQDRGDVRSRGLFAKKKKKQVGGSAGHSEESQADQSNDSDKVQERAVGPGHFRR